MPRSRLISTRLSRSAFALSLWPRLPPLSLPSCLRAQTPPTAGGEAPSSRQPTNGIPSGVPCRCRWNGRNAVWLLPRQRVSSPPTPPTWHRLSCSPLRVLCPYTYQIIQYLFLYRRVYLYFTIWYNITKTKGKGKGTPPSFDSLVVCCRRNPQFFSCLFSFSPLFRLMRAVATCTCYTPFNSRL